MRTAIRSFILAAAASGLVACGGSATSPSSYNYTGRWLGSAGDTLSGLTGNVQLNLTQNADALTGSVSIGISLLALSGPLTGSVSGDSLTMTVTADPPATCSLRLTAARSGNSLNGIYAPAALGSCALPVSGTFNVTKQ
ncbi:MAG: hypothetical protein MUF51_05535 [Vicinamibacteria bacterium]|nr:hypothetical protein [Vicinamibacteria bacterium]